MARSGSCRAGSRGRRSRHEVDRGERPAGDRRRPSATGPRTLILSAHVDVVPGHRDQFSPRRENGCLYGRGAYDMKGALAAMLAALADLAAAPAAPRRHAA